MKHLITAGLLTLHFFAGCNNAKEDKTTAAESSAPSKKETSSAATGSGQWKGSFSNGMKGATISFEVAGDSVKDLTFQGYWRCEGKLDLTTLGPSTAYPLQGNSFDGVIVEPKDGPAPFHFEVHGKLNDNKAEGTLQFVNTAAGCTTYKLNWTAEKQ